MPRTIDKYTHNDRRHLENPAYLVHQNSYKIHIKETDIWLYENRHKI